MEGKRDRIAHSRVVPSTAVPSEIATHTAVVASFPALQPAIEAIQEQQFDTFLGAQKQWLLYHRSLNGTLAGAFGSQRAAEKRAGFGECYGPAGYGIKVRCAGRVWGAASSYVHMRLYLSTHMSLHPQPPPLSSFVLGGQLHMAPGSPE